MPDVADPQIYLAGAAAILDEYPPAVGHALADPRTGTRLLNPYPSLHDLREACDRAYEPIERSVARERAADSHSHALAAPAKPNQQRRDEQTVDYETRIKPLLGGTMQAVPATPVERGSDGKHFSRIARDLELRKARNAVRGNTDTTGPPADAA